jgi:serine/threonine-protein kinase
MLRAGGVIAGKYRVVRQLGEGAMGSVWLAKNEATDREFAIKVLLPGAAAAPDALVRFFREAKVCGALRHPSILEIYDAGPAPELGGAPFLVMERLDGAPLDVVIRQRGALGSALAVDIIAHLARGLELAHAKSIIHRDLKPANVFLHRPGTGALVPKVLDFGISKMIDPASPQIALTNTSTILGSPLYMSPEQMDHGTQLDTRSDVHALGLLLWECLVGKPAFAATSYNNLVVEIMKGPRPKLRDVMPSAPETLAGIVDRAFAIDRDARFPSAAALADALDVELARLGGGVLASRNAAADYLGGLDLVSKLHPPMHGSTTEPTSFDAAARSPAARSVVQPQSSPSISSLAQTEEAGPLSATALPPPAIAGSGQRETTRASSQPSRPAALLVLGGACVVVALAGGGAWLAMRRPAESARRSAEPPPAVAIAEPSVSASPPASASAARSASTEMASTPTASSVTHTSASSAPTGAALPQPGPKRPPTPRASAVSAPAPAPAPGRPKIDQSGL